VYLYCCFALRAGAAASAASALYLWLAAAFCVQQLFGGGVRQMAYEKLAFSVAFNGYNILWRNGSLFVNRKPVVMKK